MSMPGGSAVDHPERQRKFVVIGPSHRLWRTISSPMVRARAVLLVWSFALEAAHGAAILPMQRPRPEYSTADGVLEETQRR